MKKMVLPAILGSLMAVSCAKNEVKNETTAEVIADSVTHAVYPEDTLQTVATGDTTETSVDWNGTYNGKLPCASCPGIETTLKLNSDKTYEMEEKYLEEKDGDFKEKGIFAFSKDGSFITLSPSPAENAGQKRVYFVTEGAVYQAEREGDRSSKADYKLTKKH